MEYVSRPTLDRATGDMLSVPMGNWITISELGERYGVGSKNVRSILHHMGLLQPEAGRYRLSPRAVAAGLGKRIEKGRGVRFPFDVVSPACQEAIAEAWDFTVADLETEKRASRSLAEAQVALVTYKEWRGKEMTTQMEVCWLCDHFRDRLTERELALIIGVAQPLVNRYMRQRREQINFMQWLKAHVVPVGNISCKVLETRTRTCSPMVVNVPDNSC